MTGNISLDELIEACSEGVLAERGENISRGTSKDWDDMFSRTTLLEGYKRNLQLMMDLLEDAYARVLVEARHECIIYSEEFSLMADQERPTGFYSPVVKAVKHPGSESLADGYSIGIEWRKYKKVGPQGARKTFSDSVTKGSSNRVSISRFKDVSAWERDLINASEDRFEILRDRMKRITEMKRKLRSLYALS